MRSHPATLLLLALLVPAAAAAQTWTRVTSATNPIVTDTGPPGYAGASWVDYDGDGDQDLFVNPSALYRNDGAGTFTRIATAIGTAEMTGNTGNSWADYDNDGDLDVFIAGSPSYLYRNDGGGTFTAILDGDIGDGVAHRGWACAWADFDNDGDTDLVVTHPCGFVGDPCLPNLFFVNDGSPAYTFTQQDTGVVVTGFAAYTVGTWSDYDLDGDQDLFIGSGPATSEPAPDNLYQNMLSETGAAFFTRITTSPIATDLNDGQVWNWIDYDNDRDLDAYVTNWGGGGSISVNRLYRNDGGVYVDPVAGPIDTDARISLGSIWGDYDNDGDLDCYVTNDASQRDNYYRNDGTGVFANVTSGPASEFITHRGGAAGDYDGDGDLDLFLAGPGNTSRLYRNDTMNGNAWLELACVGNTSNRAAIGARIEVLATIGGVPRWQMREVSAQNTFNGHNMLVAHIGLAHATVVDTAIVFWPSGIVDTLTALAINQKVTVTESAPPVGVDLRPAPVTATLSGARPNPFRERARIGFTVAAAGPVRVEVFDVAGRRVATPLDRRLDAGRHEAMLDGAALAPGLYLVRLTTERETRTTRVVRVR